MIARLRALATSPTAKAAVLLGLMGWATGKLMELATGQQQLHEQLTAAVAERGELLAELDHRISQRRAALAELEEPLPKERTYGDVDQADPHAD